MGNQLYFELAVMGLIAVGAVLYLAAPVLTGAEAHIRAMRRIGMGILVAALTTAVLMVFLFREFYFVPPHHLP